MYNAYDQPVRLWGISVINDQQLAGAIMKIGGGMFLWTIVIYLFFKRFAARFDESHNYRRGGTMPDAEIVGHDEVPLTTADVDRAFAESDRAARLSGANSMVSDTVSVRIASPA